ncbi:MAG: hypothetical protein HRU69_08390 [Flammeovirgaceae bacterium]|nr:MAG: hypothetical protein HRU69_08390 [Flammeovirgaceae bacterium]
MRGLFWTLGISITILLGGLILYFSHFNNGYADNSDGWADFATFNGYFLSIVNLIVLGYISLITYEATKAFNRLQIRPLLFITLDKPEQIKGIFKDSWFAVNGAKNPALNLIVRYTTDRKTNSFTKWVSCTSLNENQRLELFWIHWADKIEICFSDLTSERFYRFEFMDYFGQTKEIKREEYFDKLKEAKNNRDNNMTHLRDKFEEFLATERQKGNSDPMKNYTTDFIDKNLR